MKDSPIKTFVIVGIIVLVFFLSYQLIKKLTTDDSLDYSEFLKNYEVNEYIATYVSDEDMAKIYLNDYIHNMYYDVENAYSLLDEEYRNKKFGSLVSYKAYVKSLNFRTYTLDRYYISSDDGYLTFGVYDNNGNFYAFKTNGVMQYKVYLDDYTVEI